MKVGIVLSGGGIRGIAHLGILKAFSNLGITFSHISGTSAGAIAGRDSDQAHFGDLTGNAWEAHPAASTIVDLKFEI